MTIKTGKIKNRIWNRNYILLWQGSLVSSFGDVIYSMAMGFWVLSETGSTALMGALMATTALPRITLSPFAGVWVDRYDRRRIMVISDFICGIIITLIAIFAFTGFLRIWMVFISGFISGTCSAFFFPATASILPDLIEKKNIEKANSFLSMTYSGAELLGSPSGGILFSFIGAPLMFLINGLSFLFSSMSELFMKIPKVIQKNKKVPFMTDLKAGIKFTWNYTGLRLIFLAFSVINFFAVVAFILILPLFQQTTSLGSIKYGIVMASLTTGSLLGMVIIGTIKITSGNRLNIFIFSSMAMSFGYALFPFLTNFYMMIISAIIGGLFNAIMIIMITSTIQQTIPQDMRGKVFGLLETIGGGLTPIAMAIGGLLGEFLPIRGIIAGSVIMIFIILLPICLSRETRKFFEFDSESNQLKKKRNKETESNRFEVNI